MDLDVKDVADLLNVAEETIQQWLAEGTIPGYRIHHQWRFSRDEIEAWMMKRKVGDEKNLVPNFSKRENKNSSSPVARKSSGMKPFSLYRALSKGQIYTDIIGKTKEEIFRHAMERIATELDLDVDVVTELLLDRENLNPTALANGVGIPHARDFLLNRPYDLISIVFPKEPIPYGALDGQPVHTLFFLFASEDKRHLHLLAKIAHLSSQPEMITFLKKKPEKEELLEIIRRWESGIAPATRNEDANAL